MRILHVADRLTDRGGAYTHLLGLLAELSPAHDLALAVGRLDRVDPPCPAMVCAGLDVRGDVPVPALDSIAVRARFDLVHVHNVVNPAVLRWAANAGPAVVTVQDHRFFCPGRGKWKRDGTPCGEAMSERACAGCFETAAYFRETLALTQARLEALRRLPVVVLSEYMRSELVKVGLRRDRMHVIPPFVHAIDPGACPDGPACVAFVGRLAEAKGVRDAIAAWRRSGVDLPLVLAGSGPLRAELQREGFHVTGWLDRAQLSALYKRARAILLPSRWQEPFGIVGPEALSMGAPVVAWESGGVREWYRGERVAWGDVDGLARALRTAVEQPDHPACVALDRRALMQRLERLYRDLARQVGHDAVADECR